MKYKIEARTRVYKREEFEDYIEKCTISECINHVVIEEGECNTIEELKDKLWQYYSSILADNYFVFVTECIINSAVNAHDNIEMAAPLSDESWDKLSDLW
jgi:hypothetical protein|nr:MAG TPA: hypothetical protein [Caudoviricetes sp.]